MDRVGDLALVVEQAAPARGDVEGNLQRVADAASGRASGLVVFPELFLTGYSLGHRTPEVAIALEGAGAWRAPPTEAAVAFGLVERGRDQRIFNTAAVFRDGELLARHRKIHLPTYGAFEEGRYFAPGRKGPRVFELDGWRIGLLVCEDLWHPALPYLLGLQGAELVVVAAAPPGRGEPGEPDPLLEEGGHPPAGGAPARRFASNRRWELLARTTALHNGLFVALVNRVGVEDGLTFAGGSLVADPQGEVLARAPDGDEARLEVSLERDALRRARHPFSHLRDEEPGLILRELARLVGEDAGAPDRDPDG